MYMCMKALYLIRQIIFLLAEVKQRQSGGCHDLPAKAKGLFRYTLFLK